MTNRSAWQWQGMAAQIKSRKEYKLGPASGPGIWRLYKKYFNQSLKNKKKARCLVLGATPELRDLVLDRNYQLVSLDMSEEMILKMSVLMKNKNSANEIIVKSNWLSSPLKNNLFDLIMGDFVAVNIPTKLLPTFFKEMKRLLKPGGYILIREAVTMKEFPFRKPEEIISLSRKGKWDVIDLWYLLYSTTSLGGYNRKTKKASYIKLFPGIKRLYKQGKLNKKEFDALWAMKSGASHYFLPQDQFINLMSKYFKVLPTQKAKDFIYCQSGYHFWGKVKK